MTRSRAYSQSSSMAALQWRTEDERPGSMCSDDTGITIEDSPVRQQKQRPLSCTLPARRAVYSSSGDDVSCCSDSVPKNNNSATHYDTLPAGKAKVENSMRHSFRNKVKRRSVRFLKHLKPGHLKMSSHTKRRKAGSLSLYTIPDEYSVSSCMLDTGDFDRGEVIFFSYSNDGLSYSKHPVPICNAGCRKHKVRWFIDSDDDEESHHGEDYDSGGEFGECDEHQVDEVLADYSLREAPSHAATLLRLPSSHSFEAMSEEEFSSSFAYCETEHRNTIRRSTLARKKAPVPADASLSSVSSRKSRFVANVNKKITTKAWPLRSLWQFLTRQKDDSYKERMEQIGETMESALRYIKIASHFENADISVNLTLQRVDGASPHLQDVQLDLITTALKAFFTQEENIHVTWVDNVPTEIQRQIAVGNARVHFSVPDIRHCVACLLLSPDAAVLLRRRESVLLQSITEVLECHDDCLLVMQTKPHRPDAVDNGIKATNGTLSPTRSTLRSSPPRTMSPPKDAIPSVEWISYIPSVYS